MKVSNPLTIIAIFSGLAEALATIALVQLPLEVQSIFIYFVMAFPTFIVLLFFFVLCFKNSVLYAPSDYDDPEHYLIVNKVKQNINNGIEEVFSKLEETGKPINKSGIEEIRAELKNKITSSLDVEALTKRELHIHSLLQSGKAVPDIASELYLSPKTVLAHVANINRKLHNSAS